MNNNRWLQALIILLVIIAASWLAGQVWLLLIQFANIILLFFLGWLLGFVLSPFARRLQAGGLPQAGAVAVVYMALLLVLTLGGLLLFPVLADQIQRLIDQTPQYSKALENLGNQALIQMQKNWGVRVEDIHLDSVYGTVADQVKNIGSSVLSFISGLATLLFNTIIVLLLSFYFLKDGDRLFNGTVVLLPRPLAEEVQLLGTSIGRAFGAFLRGQLVFAILYGFLNALIMALFGLDYVLIASIVAGMAMVIPLLGGFLAYLPPLLVILVSANAGNWWLLLIVLFVVQTLMIQVVSPRIMSQAVGMHPLFVVLALLAGLQVAGPWGALFGIPVAGVLHQVAGPYYARLRGFFDVPHAGAPALALEGTVPAPAPPPPVPAPTVILGVADAQQPATLPAAFIPADGHPNTFVILARGLTRRVLTGRRRPRPR